MLLSVNEDELLSPDDVPEDYAFQGVAQTSWTLVQQHLGIAEKCHGRAVLAHNCKVKHVLPSWSLGVTQVPSLMIPSSAHDSYCELVRRQAADRLEFMENALNRESAFSLQVAAVQSETAVKSFETEQDGKTFPLIRDRVQKMARSRAGAYGRRIFDTAQTSPVTNDEILAATLIPAKAEDTFKPTGGKIKLSAPRNRDRRSRSRPRRAQHAQRQPAGPTRQANNQQRFRDNGHAPQHRSGPNNRDSFRPRNSGNAARQRNSYHFNDASRRGPKEGITLSDAEWRKCRHLFPGK